MAYRPIPNPVYQQWQSWPHIYRHGGWLGGLGQDPLLPDPGSPAPDAPQTKVVDWRCWDRPGFKQCQQKCFDDVQSSGAKDNHDKLISDCFWANCVTPCHQALPPEKQPETSSGPGFKLSPMVLAAGVVVAGAVYLTIVKKGKRT